MAMRILVLRDELVAIWLAQIGLLDWFCQGSRQSNDRARRLWRMRLVGLRMWLLYVHFEECRPARKNAVDGVNQNDRTR
jgi:hypothetical protein